jgi:hypothetical protein
MKLGDFGLWFKFITTDIDIPRSHDLVYETWTKSIPQKYKYDIYFDGALVGEMTGVSLRIYIGRSRSCIMNLKPGYGEPFSQCKYNSSKRRDYKLVQPLQMDHFEIIDNPKLKNKE